MDIRICSYFSASLLLEQQPMQWDALVMLDSGIKATDFVGAHTRSHLYLRFDDVEKSLPEKLSPTSADVEEGLEFAKGKDQLIVCCRAGQGRSAAMAYLIGCQHRGVEEAITLLDPTKHKPNRLVVTLGDAHIGDPDILDRFEDWRARHAAIKLLDYVDRMEEEFDALLAQGATNRITIG